MLYPYGEGAEPIVDCAALRTTDVQLQAGETVTDLAIGDQERWMATPASSGDPRDPVPHIALKPQAPGIETNLTIYTTRHIYHLVLRSHARAMQEVEFYYPEELLAAMRDGRRRHGEGEAGDRARDRNRSARRHATAASSRSPAVDPSQLNFSYEIDGPNVPWRPLRAFDDGSHVYLEMPAGMKSSEAPALLIAAGGGTQMVNYRVRGSYFVVDRLFEKGVLLAGRRAAAGSRGNRVRGRSEVGAMADQELEKDRKRRPRLDRRRTGAYGRWPVQPSVADDVQCLRGGDVGESSRSQGIRSAGVTATSVASAAAGR